MDQMGPMDQVPVTVRALRVLLILELATYACLTVLALISAGLGYAVRDRGGFGDIAAVLSLIVAAVSAVLFALTLAAWVAVRSRAGRAIGLVVAVQVVPVLLLVAVRANDGGLLGLTAAWIVVAAIGVALALWPATRGWLTGVRPVPPG